MTTYVTIELRCPNCRHVFRADKLTSTNFHQTTTDLHRLTVGFDPLGFLVHTCEKCGFTGPAGDYDGSVSPDVTTKLRDYVAPFVKDEQTTPARRWEFAALIAEWRALPAERIAQDYLNATWCSQEEPRSEEVDQEVYYRRKAIQWLEEAMHDPTTTASRPVLTYLIGEFYRRVGDQSMATTWFERVSEEAAGDGQYDWVLRLARQQQTAPAELIE